MKDVRVNHSCLSSCWLLAPSKQKRLSVSEDSSSGYQVPSSGSFSQTMCTTQSERRRSNFKARPTSKMSTSSPSQNYRESLSHPKREGSYVHSPNSFYCSLTGCSFPHTTRTSLNQHCSQQQRVNSPSSRSSPMIYSSQDHKSSPTSRFSMRGGSSPDMTRRAFNQHCLQQQRGYSPSSRPSPMSYSSPDICIPSSSSPDMTRKSFNQHCLQQRRGYSPSSRPSPMNCSSPDICIPSSRSPDMTRKSFNQHCLQQQRGYSPSSRPSPMNYSSPDICIPSSRSSVAGYSSPDMRRKSFNQHCDQQRSVHSPSSLSSPVSSPSRDLTGLYFNQHCYQHLHPASSLKQCRSPRRNSKPGSGKSSRRKRIGVRSPAHRTGNLKSPGRAPSGCAEYVEDKKYEMRSRSHRSSNSITLATMLSGCNEENEDKRNAMPSPFIRTSYCTSSGRTADRCKGDSSPRYPNFYDGLVAVERVISSPISRKAALSLIQRHKLFANRKFSISSTEHARRSWAPALESISEVI